MKTETEYNILVIDDNTAIHQDFKKILISEATTRNNLEETEKALFDDEITESKQEETENFFKIKIDSAFQGDEGLDFVRRKFSEQTKYAIAFVDVRMPPGWDGVKTAAEIWKIDPEIQIVICSAYSDYSWEDITTKLGETDQLLVLKKPFDVIEVRQIVTALLKKWEITSEIKARMLSMRLAVENKSQEIENYLCLIKKTLEATTDGVMIFTKEGNLIDINDKALIFWGLENENVIKENFDSIRTHILSRLTEPEKFSDYLLNENVNSEKEFLERLNLQNGTVLECCSKPQYIKEEMIARIWCFHDITEYLTMQQSMIQSEKMMSLGLLATGTAHELNQPLSIIQTNLQSLEFLANEALSKEEVQEIVSSVLNQINRASSIINRLRSLANNNEEKYMKLNIVSIINKIVSNFINNNALNNIEIINNFAEKIPDFYFDEQKLETIITQLLANAKYALEKKGSNEPMKILLDVNHDKNLEKIYLKVKDNGIGMSDEVRARCFDPFYSTRAVGEGAGLGLSIVYNLIKNAQGIIEIKSEVNKGTEVNIILPINPSMPNLLEKKSKFQSASFNRPAG